MIDRIYMFILKMIRYETYIFYFVFCLLSLLLGSCDKMWMISILLITIIII